MELELRLTEINKLHKEYAILQAENQKLQKDMEL
jgi:hypothetical protein